MPANEDTSIAALVTQVLEMSASRFWRSLWGFMNSVFQRLGAVMLLICWLSRFSFGLSCVLAHVRGVKGSWCLAWQVVANGSASAELAWLRCGMLAQKLQKDSLVDMYWISTNMICLMYPATIFRPFCHLTSLPVAGLWVPGWWRDDGRRGTLFKVHLDFARSNLKWA